MKIEKIRIDGGTQPREAISVEVVTEYTEAIIDGAAFPPVTVYHDGTDYWLADGFHRLAAHKAAKREEIKADVIQGTRRDAIWHSFGANKAHGLRRQKGDARRAIERILKDEEWSKVPQTKIAEHVGVNQSTVSRIQKDLMQTHKIDRGPVEVTRNGKTYTQNTENIGKNSAQNMRTENTYFHNSNTKHGESIGFDNEYEESSLKGVPPIVNLGEIPPDLYREATTIGGTISRMAQITDKDPEEMARGFKAHEKARVVDNALKSIEWLEQFVQAMEG